MRNILVEIYDESTRTFIDTDDYARDDLILSPRHSEEIVDILLRVDEIIVSDTKYRITSRCFNLEENKLVLNVMPK